MLAIASRILRDRCDAEEVLHDVFLESWRRSRDFDASRGTVEAWLCVRTRSRAMDRLRRRRRLNLDTAARPELVDDPRRADPALTLMLNPTLDRLSPPQRQVLHLQYFEGLTCKEIASRLSIPIGTVKSRLAKGLAAMRQELRATAA
jgi:RNA polymerase sigma-70 factor (ECF subfamily)